VIVGVDVHRFERHCKLVNPKTGTVRGGHKFD